MVNSCLKNPVSPRLRSILFFLALLFIVTGCRLQTGKTIDSGVVPEKTIAIPLFSNITFEPILEKELTRIFKETFYNHGWQVENNPRVDDLVLSAKIISFSQFPTSLTPTGGARENRIQISVEIQVFQGEKQDPVFSKTVIGIADYISRPNVATARASKNRAIREAGRKMAEQVSAFIQMPLPEQAQVTIE